VTLCYSVLCWFSISSIYLVAFEMLIIYIFSGVLIWTRMLKFTILMLTTKGLELHTDILVPISVRMYIL
jgi:hypothetical protein